MSTPEVTVIMATYNRSNIVGYAIASVVGQSFQNWELLVIGDCCTDDTDAVVEGFADERIRFVNLSQNFGEQSGPNNEGLKMARGQYIAFLNHDDLWFREHLQVGLDCVKRSGADLVLAGGVVDHGPDLPLDITGLVQRKTGYDPQVTFVPASNWLFKSELVSDVGYWRPARDLFMIPSYDWQQRVYKLGKKIIATEKITVIALPSSSRKNTYSDRAFEEHELYFRQLNSPDFRVQLYSRVLFDWGQKYYYDDKIYLRRAIVGYVKRILSFLGVNTVELGVRLRFGKGGVIKKYRKKRGLH